MSVPSEDPFADPEIADPYPRYAQLRSSGTVHWSDKLRCWVFLAYADVAAALRDDARFSADRRRAKRPARGADEAPSDSQPPVPRIEQPSPPAIRVVSSDPPECLAVRALLNDALVPRVRAIAPRIDEIVDELLAALAPRREADLVADFAYALPIRVIADLLDVPEADRARFQALSHAIARGMDRFYAGGEVKTGLVEIGAYFASLLRARGAGDADDVMTRLLAARRAGDRLSELEVVAMCSALVFGGHETTVNLIANGLLALLRNPAELDRLRADPALVPSAVEELLRYDSPPQFLSRVVAEDTLVGDRALRTGDSVLLGIGPANRDPAAFPDPDRLDVARTPNPHLAFGVGTHFCPGAQLSRLETRAAIGALIARFPNLQLAGEPQWRRTFILRGLERLPVRFA